MTTIAILERGVKSWASILDENTRRQAEVISRAPDVAGHVALMPDAHLGMGATVGSVIPTAADRIIPAAVGVDIGCGMVACKTDLDFAALDLTDLHRRFSRSIPAGVGRDHKSVSERVERWFADNPMPHPEVFDGFVKRGQTRMLNRAKLQLGTLGSGNHFVEVCLDRDDNVWCLLHSGSRNVGNAIARRFTKTAADEHAARGGEPLEDPDTAALRGESFDLYIAMMQWAQSYAYANREFMLAAMLDDMRRSAGDFEIAETINCHHNFAALEEHFGRTLWITRKGAIRARVGDRGIIPGSMGAATYIVEGKGNADSYTSCAHGAGRMFSRSEARRRFDEESLAAMMRGKAWNARNAKNLLDEHPNAYKDIETVMSDQRDLVETRAVLRQVVNYKG